MAKPIEQQIAELTIEQRNSLPKIYKKYLICLGCIVLAGIIVLVSMFAVVSMKLEKAQERYERLETQQALNEMNGTFDFALSDEKLEAMDEYYDMIPLKPLSLCVGGAIILIGTLALFLIFRLKYPYFSEKKYTYLKKRGYYNAPQQSVAPQNYNQNYPQYRQ